MLKKLNELAGFFGLTKKSYPEVEKKPTYKFVANDFRNHVDYLKLILDFEKSRGVAIENKLSQLTGQSSIVLSLLALFIPIMIDKFEEQTVWKIFTIILFLFCFLAFVIAIFHSTKTLDIKNFSYSTGNSATVTKEFDEANGFEKEFVSDLISSLNRNSSVDNQKGNILLFAQRSFRTGIILVGLLGIFLTLNLFTRGQNENTVRILNQVELSRLEKSLDSLKEQLDTNSKNLSSNINQIILYQDSLLQKE